MSERFQYSIGPFKSENFEQGKWKHIRDKIFQLNNTNEEETIGDCRELLQLLNEMNHAPNLDQYFGETTIKNYFLNDYLLTNAKNLICTKTFINNELLEISNAILEQMVLLWAKYLEDDNGRLAELPKLILDSTRNYFKLNNQEDTPHNVIVFVS